MNFNRYLYLLILVILGGLIVSCSEKSASDSQILAIIGDDVITEQQFVEIFTDFKRKAAFQDNGQTRRQVLDLMVRQKLLMREAEKRGYTTDASAKYERKRLRIQGLLNEYYATYISPTVRVTEADLREYFRRFNTRIKARHLYAPTKSKADSLYQLLVHGQSFVQLASQVFTDPTLKNNGGLVGYFTVDEMHPNFEDAAFHLKVGEISKPVKIAGGYSIIKVEDKIVNPLLTESEFANKKDKLKRYVIHRKRQQAAAAFVEEKRKDLQIQVNPQTLQKLFAHLQGVLFDAHRLQFNIEQGFNVPQELANAPLVSSQLGTWTVAQFLEKARFTSPGEWKWVRYPENLEEFIAGLVVREYMLRQAEENQLTRHKAFQKYISQHWTDFVLQRLEDSVQAAIPVPEDSIRDYYEKNRDKFTIPPQVCLREIVVTSPEASREVVRLLRAGKDFAEVAREYSQRTVSAQRGGYLGCFSKAQLKRMGDTFFNQEAGHWIGPLKQKSVYVFYYIDQKLPGRVEQLADVREDIIKAYRYMHLEGALNQLTDRLKKEIPVQIYWKRLRSISIKRG